MANHSDQQREFGTEMDVARITGIARRTLQKHRFFHTGLPYYKLGRRVLYDLAEVRAVVRATQIDPGRQ